MKASTDKIKVIESIDGRVGGYYFLPTLIASRSRRKQRPLYSAHPMGITESPFFDRAGSEGCIKGWSPRMLQAWHHKPIDSTRVETGQPSFRGRVRCQSHLVAWERRRREPGSNSVSDTASLTRCEGQVLRLGGVRRVRKIFAGCPAIRPIWDQSPGRTASRFETVGNRLYPSHGQNSLCRFAAEAKIQDRSRDKTGPNTAPAFPRVYNNIPSTPRWERARVTAGVTPQIPPRHSRGGGNPEKNKARHLPPFAQPKRPTTGRGKVGARFKPALARRACHSRHMGWELDVTWRKPATGIGSTSSSGIVPATLMNLEHLRPSIQRYGAALNYRDFRWIWLGSLGGQSAFWALVVARGLLVLDLTQSSWLVGVTTFAAMAPRFLIPPIAGFMADRFDRKTVLAASYSMQFLNVGFLTVLTLTDVLEVWHIIVLSVLNGSFRTFQMTATQALVPNLVPRRHLLNAIAMNQVSLQGARLFGPALIAPALWLYGPGEAFAICTALYVVGMAGVFAVRTRSTGGLTKGSSMGASLWEATRYVWADSQLKVLFVFVALHCAMVMSFESMLPVLGRDVFGDAETSANFLMMGVGAGALVGVFSIAGIRSSQGRGALLLLTAALSGVAMLVLALSSNIVVAMLGTVAMGGAQAAFMTIGGAMIQTLAPDEMRGRITGLAHINIGGTMALVNLFNGWAAGVYGAQNVLWVMGASFIVVVVASMAVGTLRDIYRGVFVVPARAT